MEQEYSVKSPKISLSTQKEYIYIDAKNLQKFPVIYILQYLSTYFKVQKDAEVAFGSFLYACPIKPVLE